jgi:hypothetical protein
LQFEQGSRKLLKLKEIFFRNYFSGYVRGDRRQRASDKLARPDAIRYQGTDRRNGPVDRRGRVRYVGLGLVCLGLAAPAHAQIYTSRDANGHLVLSNHPPGSVTRTYDVPKADSVRTTRPAGESLRSGLYDDLISEHAHLNSVRTDLVRAVVQVESGFNPYARSPKGALGLMQLMPATSRRFGVKNPLNPVDNVRAGVAYLRQLLDRYQNDESLALAAYNAGPGAVDTHGQRVPPYRETQNYVKRISNMSPRPVPLPVRKLLIYKTTENVDGHPVPRYSDHEPATGSYEVVSRTSLVAAAARDHQAVTTPTAN